jgi:hypothetical protein
MSPSGSTIPDAKDAAERLASIARQLSLQLSPQSSPLQMLDQILRHVEQYRPLMLKGLGLLSSDLKFCIPEGPVSVEELGQVRRLLGFWEVLPAYLPPLQPRNWSNRFLNTQYQFALGEHERIYVYFKAARDRLGPGFAHAQLPHPFEYYEQIGRSRYIEMKLGEMVNKVQVWMQTGQLLWKPDLFADLIELELDFFRSNNSMQQEVKGAAFDFDPLHLYVMLDNVIDRVGPFMPRAAAEALNVLNLLTLAPVVNHVTAGNAGVPIGSETVTLVAKSLALESQIWTSLDHGGRALAAVCCHVWLRSFYSDFEPDFLWTGTTTEEAAGLGLQGLKAQATECPLFGVMAVDSIGRMEFAAHRIWQAMDVTPETAFATLNELLGPLAANPSALPHRLRYRPVVRAMLSTNAPILELTSFHCRNNRVPEALAAWHLEWDRTRSRLLRLELPASVARPFAEWRTELAERAKEKVLHLEEERVTAEMSFEEFGHRIASMAGSISLGAQSTSEMLLDITKKDFPLYFVPSYPTSSLASIDRSRQFVESICARLHELDVDLLVVTFASVGISILHYRSDQNRWQSANGIPEFSQAALGALAVDAGRSGGEGSDAGWGSPELPEGMTATQLMSRVADQIVQYAFERHQIRARNCLLIAPDLEGLPLTCSLAVKLHQQFGDEAQLAELSRSGRAGSFAEGSKGGRFAGYRDPSLEDEIIWQSLGLSGEVRLQFSADDLLSALESDKEILHVVTHGVLDYQAPAFSFMVCNQAPLFSFDLFSRKFSTKLLLLNTCSSGAGGAFGAASGYSPLRTSLEAGVEVAIGNLFPVETELAARFAIAFQRSLVEKKGSCATAFCRAVGAAGVSSDEIPSFMLVGRSLESLFSERWANALLSQS